MPRGVETLGSLFVQYHAPPPAISPAASEYTPAAVILLPPCVRKIAAPPAIARTESRRNARWRWPTAAMNHRTGTEASARHRTIPAIGRGLPARLGVLTPSDRSMPVRARVSACVTPANRTAALRNRRGRRRHEHYRP